MNLLEEWTPWSRLFYCTSYSTHLNLIWSSSLNSLVGMEWLHAYRELLDGSDGEIDRIQITSSYKF